MDLSPNKAPSYPYYYLEKYAPIIISLIGIYVIQAYAEYFLYTHTTPAISSNDLPDGVWRWVESLCYICGVVFSILGMGFALFLSLCIELIISVFNIKTCYHNFLMPLEYCYNSVQIT